MSRLDAATERFHAALENLNKTTAPLAQARESAGAAAIRLAAITEERNRLLARIEELEDEARSLSNVTHEVEGRLDGAIADIRAALGR
jgi:ABC-type transporter Mla subunit MlaD